MQENRIQHIERYVGRTMAKPLVPDLMIAHDFKHVDRVRRWALQIARDGPTPYPLAPRMPIRALNRSKMELTSRILLLQGVGLLLWEHNWLCFRLALFARATKQPRS